VKSLIRIIVTLVFGFGIRRLVFPSQASPAAPIQKGPVMEIAPLDGPTDPLGQFVAHWTGLQLDGTRPYAFAIALLFCALCLGYVASVLSPRRSFGTKGNAIVALIAALGTLVAYGRLWPTHAIEDAPMVAIVAVGASALLLGLTILIRRPKRIETTQEEEITPALPFEPMPPAIVSAALNAAAVATPAPTIVVASGRRSFSIIRQPPPSQERIQTALRLRHKEPRAA